MAEPNTFVLEARIARLEELVISICDLHVPSAPVQEIKLEMCHEQRGTWWTPLLERVDELQKAYEKKLQRDVNG